MSKCKQIKAIIAEVFGDGKIHTIEEVTLLAIEKQIIVDKGDSAIKNSFYQMKRDNTNFISVGVGKYQMKGYDAEENRNELEEFDKSLEYILKEIYRLKNFDWVNCTDNELLAAREKISKIKKLSMEVQKIIR